MLNFHVVFAIYPHKQESLDKASRIILACPDKVDPKREGWNYKMKTVQSRLKMKSSSESSPPVPRERRKFDEALRRHAVDLVNSGRTVASVARELGVGSFSLYEWRGIARRNVDLKTPIPTSPEALADEIKRLREALHRSQLREESLKKVWAFLPNVRTRLRVSPF